jgi:hypothetical protein
LNIPPLYVPVRHLQYWLGKRAADGSSTPGIRLILAEPEGLRLAGVAGLGVVEGNNDFFLSVQEGEGQR